MLKIFNSAFYLINIVIFVHGRDLYTVVAPGKIRPYFNYNVAITVHETESPCEIEVGITASTYNISKVINMLPMSTKNIQFKMPKLEKDDYRLFIKGLSGIRIENSTHLDFDYYNPLVYILVDKPIYKPGDLVQFRVLFLNQKTQPEQLKKPMSIAIKDGGFNMIQLWKNISLIHGVYTGNFQLSEYPLHEWFHIEVYDGKNKLEEKKFGIIKFDLPNFEVFIDVPEEIALTDEVITITVWSMYTFGKPVKGDAFVTVKFYTSNCRVNDLPPGDDMIYKTFPIDGEGQVEFNIWKDLPRPELIFKASHFPFVYEVYASVVDELTGSTQNSPSSYFTLHRRNIVIEAISPPKTYHPGKFITYIVVGKKFDGTPVQDYNHPIKLNINDLVFYSMFNKSGIARFKFVLPDLGPSLSVYCKYFGTKYYLSEMKPIVTKDILPERFQLNFKTPTPQLKKELLVEVKWTEPINYFVYIIVGRGNIIKVERVAALNNTQSYNIKIIPTLEMIPAASIFVQYIFNNNLRFEEQIIKFDVESNDFQNTLEITTTAEARPGNDIEFQIKTDSNSYVGILGIDQSVWLHENQYNLQKHRVYSDLRSYETKTPEIAGNGRYPGKISGLVTLTNAHFPWSPHNRLFGVSGISDINLPVPRKRFPETWIFESFNITNQTHFSFVKTVPETITSWVITGFSMNSKSGFALTKSPTMVKVFKPFFITLNLPYSVKQGEVISIPVIIYNYLNKTVHTDVTMDNSEKGFEFVEAINKNEVRSVNQVKNKRISIPSDSARSVSFMIKTQAIGVMTIKVNAVTKLAADSIQQNLKVEPEGIKIYKNRAFFINLNYNQQQTETVTVDIPANAVTDSEHIEFSAIGDIIGLPIKYLENLVRLPYGFGEQNMINFVPSILVLKYLKTVNQKMPNVTKIARNMLKIGFQREMRFRLKNGSYSAYDSSDISGSGQSEIIGCTWLTAYVVRYFQQATEFIEIDQQIITDSLEFLITKQTTSGNFAEFGQLLEFSHLNDVRLSAFVVLAFLENKQNFSKYETYIKKGVTFLLRSLRDTDDIYALSITALVLQKVNHQLAHEVLAKIILLAKNENGYTWWTIDTEDVNSKRSNAFKSSDIVITSYILQAMLEKGSTVDVLPIVRWLTKKRNSNGGFTTTQDTVVGLEALIKFAEKTGFTRTGAMNIDYICEEIDMSATGSITIRPDNLMLLNTHELPKDTRKVTFTAKGNGSSLVQLSYSYHTIDKEPKPSFHLNVHLRKNTSPKQLIIDICAQFVPIDVDVGEIRTNVIVTEVELPTGFTIGSEKLKEICDFKTILFTETKKSDTIAVIYLRSLEAYHQKCISIEATTVHEIANQKPVPVVVYDYYNRKRSAIAYYQIKTSLCEVCEDDDCAVGCKKSETSSFSSACRIDATFFILLCFLFNYYINLYFI